MKLFHGFVQPRMVPDVSSACRRIKVFRVYVLGWLKTGSRQRLGSNVGTRLWDDLGA